jgi:hypothetical protein
MPNEKDPTDDTTQPNEIAKEPTPTVEEKPAEPTERVRSRIDKRPSRIKRWVN